ncbi:MAG: hypothetical protein JSV88_34070 [Candidatus Aminicenantes bacterium]|nr:MAG: hypothetical protein JSV88_34070 [Candidatus Aminicenantes bacterium]
MSSGRRKFLNFLGSIGLLSLIPGSSALAQRKPKFIKHPKIKGPKIKGRTLSKRALYEKLSSRPLEKIRDRLTGRFYAGPIRRTGESYMDLINWDLGPRGAQTGCLVAASWITDGTPTDSISCYGTLYCRSNQCAADTCSSYWCDRNTCDKHTCKTEICDSHSCDEEGKCENQQCPGHLKKEIFWEDFAKYPEDPFVTEIKDILKTTDVAVIKQELIKIIYSNEVLNLGAQHFVASTFRKMTK